MEIFSALLALCVGNPRGGHHWIPFTEASDMGLWYFLWSVLEQMVEQTIKTPVVWDAIVLIMTSLYIMKYLPEHGNQEVEHKNIGDEDVDAQ